MLPFARRAITIGVLKDPYALLAGYPAGSQQDTYWGELWPSSITLADAILDGSLALPSGPDPILEIGCGAGLATVAAAIAGGRVLATDRDPHALVLARENASRNGVAEQVEYRLLDWRENCTARHGLILAADCMYRAGAAGEVAWFIAQALRSAPGARAIVVDPDRLTARYFNFIAQEAGLKVRMFQREVPFVTTHGPVKELPSGPVRNPSRQPLEVTFYELT